MPRPSRPSVLSTPAPIPFAGAVIDRATHRRTDSGWLQAARTDPRAQAVLIGRDGATAGPVALGDAEPIGLLGVQDDVPVWVAAAPPGTELVGLRDIAASGDPGTAGLVAYASALGHFHRAHRFCGRCGKPTEAGEGGHTRRCPEGHTIHPRTDPVVIMLVTDGPERILLGRQAVWPEGRYSALAGFVEPGESLEHAVVREVREEAGVESSGARYIASQPWPFPASLMLGFHAVYSGGDPVPQDGELEDVRWFGRDEVLEVAQQDVDFLGERVPGEGLILPPRLAIARHLIEHWLAA